MIKEINDAVHSLKKLGIHSSFARKSLFSLLQKNKLSETINLLQNAIKNIKLCLMCNNATNESLCLICNNSSRDNKTLLIVEHISDLNSIESSRVYKGLYYVLSHDFFHDNTELEIQKIQKRIIDKQIEEIIIATNTNLNGEILSQILVEYINLKVKISRIAHGIPFGQEIHNLDSATIFSSISSRKIIQNISE